MNACVLNQYRSHWLLSNALQFAITMCLKCKEEITNPPTQVSLIDDDFGIVFEFFYLLSILFFKLCFFGIVPFFLKEI